MSHVIRIFLAVGLSIAAVLIVLLSTEHFGPHAGMDVFVAETIRSAVGQDVVIEQYVEASRPRRFQRDMIKTWFHRSAPYSMTLPPILGQSLSATDQMMTYTVENYAGYPSSLPYPPEDLWCVRLKSAAPTVPKVVLIALHQDMYTARWAVHEPIDVEAVLAAVGCQFSNP
jgi:hypothetical protein